MSHNCIHGAPDLTCEPGGIRWKNYKCCMSRVGFPSPCGWPQTSEESYASKRTERWHYAQPDEAHHGMLKQRQPD